MQQRLIKEQEKILIHHLLKLVNKHRHFKIPRTVVDLDDSGMQSIRLTQGFNCEYLHDVVQVKYLDDDNVLVLITLTESTTHELFELDFKKVYSNKLISYPAPEKVKHTIQGKSKTLLL